MSDFKRVRLDIVLDHPEYQLQLEEMRNAEGAQMVFIHLYVWKDWSRKLLQRFTHEWSVLRKHVTCPLFACADVDDDKWVKFVTHFGFKPLSQAVCTDGKLRRIYWHQGISNGLLNPTTAISIDQRALVSPSSVSPTGVSGRTVGVRNVAGRIRDEQADRIYCTVHASNDAGVPAGTRVRNE